MDFKLLMPTPPVLCMANSQLRCDLHLEQTAATRLQLKTVKILHSAMSVPTAIFQDWRLLLE
jgi:hypothetical protein